MSHKSELLYSYHFVKANAALVDILDLYKVGTYVDIQIL